MLKFKRIPNEGDKIFGRFYIKGIEIFVTDIIDWRKNLMQTVTSAANTTITGTADNDWITSSGDGVIISLMSGDDYLIARGQGSYIYGANGNDTVILLPPLSQTATASSGARQGTQAVSADTEIHGESV